MAALIAEARAARSESYRLRREMVGLRLAVRESAADSRQQRRTARATRGQVKGRREVLLPSPWSTLHWSYHDQTLASVLVSIH